MDGARQWIRDGSRQLIRRLGFAQLVFLLVLIPSLSHADPGAELRVLSYNVWGLPGPLLKKKERFPDIRRLLPTLGADVVALQEAFHKDAKALALTEGYPYVAYGPKGRFLKQFSSGLILLSRYPITRTAILEFEGFCEGFDCLANKGMQYARILVPGIGEVDVFNTHLNAYGAEAVRLEQVDMIAEFVARHSDPEMRPLILLGDYNFSPDSPPYRRLIDRLEIRDMHLEYALERPYLSPIERDGITSDPRRNPNIPPEQTPKRIDYVFVASELAEIAATRSSLVFDAPVGPHFLSDHFGVMVDLKVQLDEGEDVSEELPSWVPAGAELLSGAGVD